MYDSLEAELHDTFWNSEGPAAELPLLREFHQNHPGQGLEVGCGSGRLLFPLLLEGFQVAGLDNSPAMIRLARQSAKEKGLLPNLYEEELSEHQPSLLYHAITFPAFTIQLFENPAEVLKDLHRLLAPKGGLYLSVFYPWAEVMGELPTDERYQDHQIELPDGSLATIYTEHSLNQDTLTLTRKHNYEISSKGEISQSYQSTQVLRYCQEDEWIDLLQATGFKVTKTIHDFDPEQEPDEEGAGVTTFFLEKTPHL